MRLETAIIHIEFLDAIGLYSEIGIRRMSCATNVEPE
jgi:hypothetical protein